MPVERSTFCFGAMALVEALQQLHRVLARPRPPPNAQQNTKVGRLRELGKEEDDDIFSLNLFFIFKSWASKGLCRKCGQQLLVRRENRAALDFLERLGRDVFCASACEVPGLLLAPVAAPGPTFATAQAVWDAPGATPESIGTVLCTGTAAADL